MKKKSRKFLWGAVVVVILAPIIALYRMPGGRLRSFKKEIRYQVLDVGQGDFIRSVVEGCFFKQRIFVVSDENEPQWFYVSESDFKRLWPDTWPKMVEEKYTIEATFSVRPLLLARGYTVATVTEIEKINKRPVVSK